MSDTPQGPDWWQASDDKWYPPPRPQMPGESAYPAAPPTSPVGPGGPVLGGAPGYGPPSGPGMAHSPYGGMPSVGPPGGGSNRTALFVVLGILGMAAVVGLILALTGGDDDDPTEPAGPGSSTPSSDEVTLPPDTGDITIPEEPGEVDTSKLVVADTGFSTYLDSFGEETTGSWGFIVENTGDVALSNVSLSVTIYDESDNIITTESESVGLIQPGEKLGYGDELYGETISNGIGKVEVQVGESLAFGEDPPEGSLTVSDVNTTGTESNLKTTFSVASTYDEQIDSPYAYAIFRDSAGKIIGGASGFVNFVPGDGTQAGEISTYNPIPNVATTEVYVDPGYSF